MRWITEWIEERKRRKRIETQIERGRRLAERLQSFDSSDTQRLDWLQGTQVDVWYGPTSAGVAECVVNCSGGADPRFKVSIDGRSSDWCLDVRRAIDMIAGTTDDNARIDYLQKKLPEYSINAVTGAKNMVYWSIGSSRSKPFSSIRAAITELMFVGDESDTSMPPGIDQDATPHGTPADRNPEPAATS